jgi:hypothetical protein
VSAGDNKSKAAIAMQHNIEQSKNGNAAPAFSASAPEFSNDQVSYLHIIHLYKQNVDMICCWIEIL